MKEPKIQQTKIVSSLFKAEPVYEGRLQSYTTAASKQLINTNAKTIDSTQNLTKQYYQSSSPAEIDQFFQLISIYCVLRVWKSSRITSWCQTSVFKSQIIRENGFWSQNNQLPWAWKIWPKFEVFVMKKNNKKNTFFQFFILNNKHMAF